MSRDANLNLPDGILQRYQRRYSDPNPSRTVPKYPRARRFSLTTFDDLKDISSRSIRSCVNNVLKSSGFTQCDQAKTAQTRRYSMFADTDVKNNLVDTGTRRSSFAEKMKSLSNDNSGHSRKRAHSDIFKKKNSTIHWNDQDLEEYQNHLSTTKPSPYSACDDQYWLSRRSKNLEQTDTNNKVPPCKYKLRDNGLIASEMSSAYGVHIQYMDRNCSRNSTQTQSRISFNGSPDLETRPPSNISCHSVKKRSIKFCPGNLPRPESRAPTADSTKQTTASLRWNNMEHDENFKYTFYNPAKKDGAFALSPTATQQSLSERQKEVEANMETGSSHSRARRLSDISFEIIGNPSLHGSPMYSGRLKLCTFRSNSFSK